MTFRNLLIRADANVAMGTGHVMRCLALSQAWQDAGGRATFAMAESTPAIEGRLRSEKMEIARIEAGGGSAQDAAAFIDLARACSAAWTVVDGYQFDSEYQRRLKDAGLKALLIDDLGNDVDYWADIVLNHNPHAEERMYRRRPPNTRLLLGCRYALLRREFVRWSGWRREIPLVARKLLVTMGGSDPDNITGTALEALSLIEAGDLEATVVVGGSNPHRKLLQQAASGSGNNLRVVANVSNIPELLAWADLAISAAGTTCWEMCFLGLPGILIDIAPNQTPVAVELDRKGAAIHVGSSQGTTSGRIAKSLRTLLDSPQRRQKMSKCGSELIDGRGAERVITAMRLAELRVRRVQPEDCQLLWEWVNDADVRSMSFSKASVQWERHIQWFHSRISDPQSSLFVILGPQQVPIGQVRYQVNGTRAIVSINLARNYRGKGLGRPALMLATEEFFRTSTATTIDAHVKPENEASIKLFKKAGFATNGTESFNGQPAVHFVLDRNQTGW